MGGPGSGRRRRPTAELKLHGTFRQDRNGNRRDDQLQLGGILDDPPQGEHARQMWDAIVGTLPPGVLGQMDTMLLRGACEQWQRYRGLHEAGEGDKALKVLVELSKLMGRLGLTPTDRSKLNIPDAPRRPTGVEARKRG